MSDRDDLRDLITSVLSSNGGELPEDALTPAWQTFVELGLPLVGADEAAGGSGGSLADVSVLVETAAEHGVGCPLIESTVANWVLARSGAEVSARARVVVADDGVEVSGDLLSGTLRNVAWARGAGTLAVFPAAGGCRLVDLGDDRVTVEPGSNVAGEPRDTVRLHRYRAESLGGAPSRDLVRARLGVLRSAAILGAATGAYGLTRRYVTEREQFGKPLIRIPAVAGGLAKMRVHLLQVRAGLDRALTRWDGAPDSEGCLTAASVVRIVAATAASDVAALAHQLHGAIGITREYPLHPLTRRLWAWRDAEVPEHEWARWLGESVVASGERALWDEISA